MSRELEFDEVMEFLRTACFTNDDCKAIIEIIKDNVDYNEPLMIEERLLKLEELTAKMDCVCEMQYSNYKKEDWSKFWRGY